MIQLGGLSSKPNLKACNAILKSLGLEDKYDATDTRQNCMNVLNRINQYRGTLFKGDVGSIQGHFSGTIIASFRNSPLGDIIATARKAIVVQAVADIKGGKAPLYLRKPSTDGWKYCYHSMGHALKDLGFEKVPIAYVDRLREFEKQIAKYNAEAPADATVDIDDAPLASKEAIEKLTVSKIKTLLKRRGISTAGNKPELVERATVELVA